MRITRIAGFFLMFNLGIALTLASSQNYSALPRMQKIEGSDTLQVATTETTCAEFAFVYEWARQHKFIEIRGKHVYASSTFIPYFTWLLYDASAPDSGITLVNNKIAPVSGYEDYPVRFVSWFGAALYCNFLNMQENLKPAFNTEDWKVSTDVNLYRLPLFTEWSVLSLGSRDTEAWFSTNSGGKPHKVASFPADTNGLFDVLGNVQEFCAEVIAPLMEADGTQRKGGTSLVSGNRIWRGGAYNTAPVGPDYFRQNINYPDYCAAFPDLGFRVVRTSSK